MDRKSIEDHAKHISSVQRVNTELDALTPGEQLNRLESQKELALIKWLSCRREFAMLFMMLNRGNRFPVDSFNVKIDSKVHGDQTYDTYVRVWRNKDHSTYHVKPYVDCGSNIIDHNFDTESFTGKYEYRYGTHRSHTANLEFQNDVDVVDVRFQRLDGYPVEDTTDKYNSIFLSALEDYVNPSLEITENTIALVAGSALKDDLNPEYANRVRLPDHILRMTALHAKDIESNS